MDNEENNASVRISISDSSDESDYYDVPDDTIARARLRLRRDMSRLVAQDKKMSLHCAAYLAQNRQDRNQQQSNSASFDGPSTSSEPSTSISWSDNQGYEHTTTPNFETLKASRLAEFQMLASMQLAQAQRRRQMNDIFHPLRNDITVHNPSHSVSLKTVSLQSVIINPHANNDGEPPQKVRKLNRSWNVPSGDVNQNNPVPNFSTETGTSEEDTTTARTTTTNVIQPTTDSNTTAVSDSERVDETVVDRTQGMAEVEGKTERKETVERIAKIEDSQLNQALLSLLECPVCLECMEPPMAQCRRGHLICHTCRGRMLRCPVCRASFTSVRNRAMEQVAEKLRYPCRHGCGVVIALRLRVHHEASCSSRRYGCPLPMCTVVAMPRDALINHFLDKHPDMVAFGTKGTFRYCRTVHQHDWIMAAHNQIFHVQFCTTNPGVSGSVTFIGPKKDARKYTYEISLVGNECSRKLVYCRETHSDLDCRTEYYAQGDAFFIPFDNAQSFIKPNRNNNTLAFSVEVQPIKNLETADETV